ncbi:MAG: hypothetical protein QXI19_09195 [Candidatus Caldarchaeum sp.]
MKDVLLWAFAIAVAIVIQGFLTMVAFMILKDVFDVRQIGFIDSVKLSIALDLIAGPILARPKPAEG